VVVVGDTLVGVNDAGGPDLLTGPRSGWGPVAHGTSVETCVDPKPTGRCYRVVVVSVPTRHRAEARSLPEGRL
jgi:hypothetical protein